MNPVVCGWYPGSTTKACGQTCSITICVTLFAPAGVEGLKFAGRYGTATVTVPPLAKAELTGGAWVVGLAMGGDVVLQEDAITATPPKRASAARLSSTEVTRRP